MGGMAMRAVVDLRGEESTAAFANMLHAAAEMVRAGAPTGPVAKVVSFALGIRPAFRDEERVEAQIPAVLRGVRIDDEADRTRLLGLYELSLPPSWDEGPAV